MSNDICRFSIPFLIFSLKNYVPNLVIHLAPSGNGFTFPQQQKEFKKQESCFTQPVHHQMELLAGSLLKEIESILKKLLNLPYEGRMNVQMTLFVLIIDQVQKNQMALHVMLVYSYLKRVVNSVTNFLIGTGRFENDTNHVH